MKYRDIYGNKIVVEKSEEAKIYLNTYKNKLKDLKNNLDYDTEGFWREAGVRQAEMLNGEYQNRLSCYRIRNKILELNDSYSKKELKKIERGILGYYFDREKDLRKQFLKAIKETDAITVNKNESIVNMDTVKAMILIGLLD